MLKTDLSTYTVKFRKEIDKDWCKNRVVDEWNKLDGHVTEANYCNLEMEIGCIMDWEGV